MSMAWNDYKLSADAREITTDYISQYNKLHLTDGGLGFCD